MLITCLRKSRATSRRLILPTALALLSGVADAAAADKKPARFDWRNDWAVEEGFSLGRDAEGFHFPTALAFVPEPGPAANDPLYFVTELRGTIKVVTNDRRVHVFAEKFFNLPLTVELPANAAEIGLAGICLDPAHGYVFATFAYKDDKSVLRNNVIRFQSRPGTFSLAPTGSTAFPEIFKADRSNQSHQIGPCQVDGDLLYVSVGDGGQRPMGQRLDTTLGKILRMTLDGAPAPDNPFLVPGRRVPTDYIWAAGLRNPFSLKRVGAQLFVAQNGPQTDTFFEVERGRRYLWNGHNWSIALDAPIVFSPSIGPVQLDFLPAGAGLLPAEFEDRFYLASCGGNAGVVIVDYDRARRAARSVPRMLLRFRGGRSQCVTGLAVGPDGLYLAPLFAEPSGTGAILTVRHDPARPHPHLLAQVTDPNALMAQRGCYDCHSRGGHGRDVGPALDPDPLMPELQAWLSSPDYRAQIEAVDRLDAEPFNTYRTARAEVAAATGVDQVRLWMTYRLLEPKFDDPDASMPNVGLTRAEAELLAAFLAKPPDTGLNAWLATRLPKSRYRHTAIAFVAGLALALLLRRASPGFSSVRG